MSVYQKMVIFLGGSIFVGIVYFVYKDVNLNVKNSSAGESRFMLSTLKVNTQKVKNPFTKNDTIGSYVNTVNNSTIIKKIEVKNDGNIIFGSKDISQESFFNEEYGTWNVLEDGRLYIILTKLNQKFIFEKNEDGSIVLSEGSDMYENKENFVFIKEEKNE